MIVARTAVKGQQILIEALDEQPLIAGRSPERQTEVTGIDDKLQEAYARAKDVISAIAEDFAEFIKEKEPTGQKIEIEFSLGLSASSGLWIISGKGECALKIKLTWGA